MTSAEATQVSSSVGVFFQYPVTFKADCRLYTQSWREARSTAQHIYEIH